MPDALFTRDRDDPSCYLPTELTRGPWSPDAQHTMHLHDHPGGEWVGPLLDRI